MNGQSGGVLGWQIPEDFGDGAFSAPVVPDAAPVPVHASQQQMMAPQLPAPAGQPWDAPTERPPSAVPFGTRAPQIHAHGYPPPPMMQPRRSLGNPDVQNGGHMLGLSTVAVGVAAIVGANYGGVYGGLAGSLFGGAGINAWRAIAQLREGTPEGKHEALVSGTYAVLAAAIGGWVAYKATSGSTFFGKPAKCNASANPSRCRFRPIT